VTDNDTVPAGAADPGEADVCAQAPAVQEATSAVARYEVSG